MDKDSPIFDNISFGDLLREVYSNTKKKESQINILIDQLKPLIKNMTDASLMVPLIREYLEISVKNDDNLVKLTAIVQRLLNTTSKSPSDEMGLTPEERKQLMEEAQSLIDKTS